MFKIQGSIPRGVYVAVSGGVDSMAAYDFLSRNHEVIPVFFDHQTETSRVAKQFLSDKFGDDLEIGNIQDPKDDSESWEEYWRNQRYAFFKALPGKVITAHHLNDCVETWIMSSIHGLGKVIPYAHANVIRPFRLNTKDQFKSWASRNKVKFVEDETNWDSRYIRNMVRNDMMPYIMRVNPGIEKVIQKKVADEKFIDIAA